MNTKDTTLGGRAPDPSGSRTFFEELFTGSLYKRNQGRLVRQLTCLAIWLFAGAAAWRFHQLFLSSWVSNPVVGYLIALAIGVLGLGLVIDW